MVSVIGKDSYTDMVLKDSQDTGYGLEYSMYSEERSSIYMCINNHQRDMELAVSDMKSVSLLSVEFLSKILPDINQSKVLVIDANIPQESIEFLCQNVNVPIFIDTVSTIKTHKILNSLSYIHTIKPNKIEAEILSGIEISSHEDLKKAAKIIMTKGVKNVFISLGAEGLFYANESDMGIQSPTPTTNITNTTGCGDAAMAGLVVGFLQGESITEQVKIANAVASVSLASEMAVNPELSIQKIYSITKKEK